MKISRFVLFIGLYDAAVWGSVFYLTGGIHGIALANIAAAMANLIGMMIIPYRWLDGEVSIGGARTENAIATVGSPEGLFGIVMVGVLVMAYFGLGK